MGIGVKVVGKEPELSQVASARNIVRDQLVDLLLRQYYLGRQVDAIFYVNVVVVDRDLEVAQRGIQTGSEVGGLLRIQLLAAHRQGHRAGRRNCTVVHQRGDAIDIDELG